MDSCEEMSRYMDPVLYEAAAAGYIDPFENDQTCLDRLLTPDENTILHVYLRNQQWEPRYTYFVHKILEMCPPLLLQANRKGETPLHLAAKFCHSYVVNVLIARANALPDPGSGVTAAKMMLRMTNGEGETALHEAARYGRGHVVEILTKEDPDFSYSANVHGETPLYIAASVGNHQVIDSILRNCISVDYGGPHGRTALHAAIIARNHGTIRMILQKEERLTKTTDENGWSPLHYAVYFSRWYDISAVKVLLEYDASAAYIAEKEKKRTALHIASIQGNVHAMEEIVSRCPDCYEQVDNRGWNALHYAVACVDTDTFRACMRRIPKLHRLKEEKDDKGNTPSHLMAALTHNRNGWSEFIPYRESEIYGLNKQELSIKNIQFHNLGEIQEEIIESLKDIGSGPVGYRRFPFIYSRDKMEGNREEEERLRKVRDSHILVAMLIATVTFAAAFTLPGGYKSDNGTAILAKKTAFIVFFISDAISMVLSISAVFIHFMLAFNQGYEITKPLIAFAFFFTLTAMVTMIIAFITGTFAVLEPVLGLAVSICLIGLSFFFFVYFVFWVMRVTYRTSNS